MNILIVDAIPGDDTQSKLFVQTVLKLDCVNAPGNLEIYSASKKVGQTVLWSK